MLQIDHKEEGSMTRMNLGVVKFIKDLNVHRYYNV